MNAFPFGVAELEAYQSKIEELRGQLDCLDDEDGALLLAGKAIRCLEDYNQTAENLASLRKEQTQQTIGLLTTSLLKVAHGSAESARNLRNISSELNSAAGIPDLAPLNARLQSVLKGICDEADRQERRVSEAQQNLDQALRSESAAIRERVPVEIDAVTGLPGAGNAVQAIESALAGKRPGYVIVYRVERIESINARFGFKAGDQILFLFAQHIAQKLHPEDTLYRWRGPCFVVLSERPAPESMLAADAARVAGTRLQHIIKVGDRESVVPVVGCWTMLKLEASKTPDDVLRRLDEFALSRTGCAAGHAAGK